MTDQSKHTALMVRAWANRLEREIDLLRDQLPVESPREAPTREYCGPKNLVGNPLTQNDRADTKNWREEPGEFQCLAGLLDLLGELRQAEQEMNG